MHVAKQVGTAAVLSGNRVDLGIGMGWMEEEFDAMGTPFAKRGKRADEMLEVMRKLWTGEVVEHHGEFFDVPAARDAPGPDASRCRCTSGASPRRPCGGRLATTAG